MSFFSRAADLLDAWGGKAAALLLGAAFALLLAAGMPKLASNPFETDLLALLPGRLDEAIPADLEARFLEKLRSAESDRATILLRFEKNKAKGRFTEEERRAARESVEAFSSALSADGLFTEASPFERANAAKTKDADASASTPGLSGASLIPAIPEAAGVLVRPEDEAMLALAAKDPKTAERRMLACLLRTDSPKLLGFSRDPFCLYDRWLLSKSDALPYSAESAEGREYLRVRLGSDALGYLLLMQPAAGVAESGEGRLTARIREAGEMLERALAQAHPDLSVRVIAAGVPLFTDAIAAQASGELSRIGALSSIGVIFLALLAFGRVPVVMLMALSVALGFGAAVFLTLSLFDRLSLVTFIFGTTLIGVAVDYSTHWFALKRPGETALLRRRRLLPSLLMAGGSSAAAYGVLALTPLPGLRQMAAIAAFGVLFALAAVLVFGPFVERFAPRRETRLMRFLEAKLTDLPRFTATGVRRPAACLALVLFLVFLAGGFSKIRLEAGIRDLSAAPPALTAAQAELQLALGLPSPAQAYFVSGKTLDEALAREAALRRALARLGADTASAAGDSASTDAGASPKLDSALLAGLRTTGLSAWLPPLTEQSRLRELVRSAIDAGAPAIEARLGAKPEGPRDAPLTLEALQGTPLAPLLTGLVLQNDASGAALMTLLSGVTPEMLPALKAAAEAMPGVRFLDITGSLSETLSQYRTRVFELLATGLLVLWGVMTLRFGRGGWRAVLPCALGIAAALAFFGWAGIPVTLFTALAAVLLMGLGVDYGIFFSASPDDGRTAAAVFFCGLTTMLSFGLLALSATPALSSFGATIAVGLVVIWCATPLLRPSGKDRQPRTTP